MKKLFVVALLVALAGMAVVAQEANVADDLFVVIDAAVLSDAEMVLVEGDGPMHMVDQMDSGATCRALTLERYEQMAREGIPSEILDLARHVSVQYPPKFYVKVGLGGGRVDIGYFVFEW